MKQDFVTALDLYRRPDFCRTERVPRLGPHSYAWAGIFEDHGDVGAVLHWLSRVIQRQQVQINGRRQRIWFATVHSLRVEESLPARYVATAKRHHHPNPETSTRKQSSFFIQNSIRVLLYQRGRARRVG